MAITANVTNGKLDKTNTTPTQNRKTSSAKASGSNLGYDEREISRQVLWLTISLDSRRL